MDKAMWARVFAQCDGDENKVRARYINKRVEWLLLEKRISDKESFVETDESKRSRIKIQRFFLGITALVFVIYIASVIQTLIASNDKADTTGHKGFEPDTYLKEKGWGASDQIINKPINSSTKPRLTFDQ